MVKYKLLGMHCEDMRFRLNVLKAEPQTKFEITPEFHRQIKKSKEMPKRRIIELTVKMVGTETNPMPFDIGIRMSAMFDLEEEIWLTEDEKEFFDDATRTIFPYLRCALTNLTAAAMINPIVFPPVDGVALFKDEKVQEEKK